MSRLRMTPATRQGLSVGLATGAYGVSFGALSVAAGLSIWQTCALSLLMFTGGSQFAFIGILGTGGGGLAATATAALLGFRNSLYSLQVAPMLDLRRRDVARRLLSAQFTIDESTAVALAQPDPAERRRGFWVTGAAVFVFWNLFTAVGAVLGDVLGDPRRYGLDGAAAAAFLALLWPRLTTSLARLAATGAAIVCLVTVPLTPAGVPVLAAAAFAAAIALLAPIPRPSTEPKPDAQAQS